MDPDLRDFWQELQTGLAVAVDRATPEKLLGVRDGIRRFFLERLGRDLPVAVVPCEGDADPSGLSLTDEEVVGRARARARTIARELGNEYHLYAVSEGGLHSVETQGETLWFIRNWTVLRGPVGEAVGASGSVQLPPRLVEGLRDEQIPFALPGTRRRGGMISSLTGGLENRRRATAAATVHALSTLFYGSLEGRSASHP